MKDSLSKSALTLITPWSRKYNKQKSITHPHPTPTRPPHSQWLETREWHSNHTLTTPTLKQQDESTQNTSEIHMGHLRIYIEPVIFVLGVRGSAFPHPLGWGSVSDPVFLVVKLLPEKKLHAKFGIIGQWIWWADTNFDGFVNICWLFKNQKPYEILKFQNNVLHQLSTGQANWHA